MRLEQLEFKLEFKVYQHKKNVIQQNRPKTVIYKIKFSILYRYFQNTIFKIPVLIQRVVVLSINAMIIYFANTNKLSRR